MVERRGSRNRPPPLPEIRQPKTPAEAQFGRIERDTAHKAESRHRASSSGRASHPSAAHHHMRGSRPLAVHHNMRAWPPIFASSNTPRTVGPAGSTNSNFRHRRVDNNSVESHQPTPPPETAGRWRKLWRSRIVDAKSAPCISYLLRPILGVGHNWSNVHFDAKTRSVNVRRERHDLRVRGHRGDAA